MSSLPFECVQCWKEQRIGEVINREAVSVDRAIFMATHAPFRSMTYLKSPHQIKSTSEADLLNELLTCASKDQHAFVVVQGAPGTGKSHLIRWLKERYNAEMEQSGQNEQVLLIERAQNSLIGTLLQIINSGLLDDKQMQDHRAKLTGATNTLSERALADNILDHLRVATYEVSLDASERPKKFITSRIERFLLDPMVREELKRSGGPVERLVGFLSRGSTSRTGNDELPGFQADDFRFELEALRNIRGEGYREAKELADNLNQRDELRDELAHYLNRLLNYAIGRTTALSAEGLKQIFGDLRRYLRQQGYHLALFIEDITAFTGIDSALIDVLATQHTGESNREFCRLLSVIGITDYYFSDRFPDNMRERIGYHLSLNASAKTGVAREESDLLQDPDTTTDLVARYLNAMRVSQEALDEWLKGGGRPEELPNPCTECVYREICHAAFGAFSLTDESEQDLVQVGLYPFNARAIWTMYQRIDTTMTSRTPRSLLNSVLLYVMQSHAHTIATGTFPPPAKEMGSEFAAPSLPKPLQRTTISTQGGNDASRIESLVLFWGNGTVDATQNGSEKLVGGVPEAIFKAFGVRFIEGEVGSTEQPTTSTTISGPSTKPEQPPVVQPPEVTPPVTTVQSSKYTDDISRWRDGEKLQNYEDIRRFLFNFLSSAIDWEAYNLSLAHLNNRFTGRRIEIEGQVGRAQGECLQFPRSPELALVLQALADLNDSSFELNRETIGGHLANLATWLRDEEARIVAFVQQPHSTIANHPSLTEILLYDCLLIDWLCGNLRISHAPSPDLLLTAVKNAATKELTEQKWASLIENAQMPHAVTWAKLLKRLKVESVNECRRNLLQALNCPQGGSTSVLFIDAATALDNLAYIKNLNWEFPPIDVGEGQVKDPVWVSTLAVYHSFQSYLETVVQEECQHIQQHLNELQQYMGQDTPKQVVQAIQDALAAFQKHQKNYHFNATISATPQKLEKSMNYLQALLNSTNREETMLRLSGAAEHMQTIQALIVYFKQFVKEFQAYQERLDQRLANLRQDDATIEPLRQEVRQRYAQIVQEVSVIGGTHTGSDEETAE